METSHSYSKDRMAAGLVLGAAMGIIPLLGFHSLLFLALPLFFHVSPRGFLLGWVIGIPVGFLLDPIFDSLGYFLLTLPALAPVWTWLSNTPVVPLLGFRNTVNLGSALFWAVTAVPAFFFARAQFAKYQARIERFFGSGPLATLSGNRVVMRLFAIGGGKRRGIRKGVVLPLAVTVVLVVVGWWIVADPAARIGVERLGTAVVGATVNVEDADLDFSDGLISLANLQVTDPATPENNLFQASTIAGALSPAALLEARLQVDSVVLRDLQFNVPRESPGIVYQRQQSSIVGDEIARWRAAARVPSLPRVDFGGIVDVDRLAADSLLTVIESRRIAATVREEKANYISRIEESDPSTQITAARALARELEGASPRTLGVAGTARKAAQVREVVAGLDEMSTSLQTLASDAGSSLAAVRARAGALDSLRELDYANALGSLDLPSLDPDRITSALLEEPIADRVKTLVYWARMIDSYLPDEDRPGIFDGVQRVRNDGRVVVFPQSDTPAFSLNKVVGSVVLGQMSDIAVELFDVSSNPRATGRPTVFRLNGQSDGSAVAVEAVIDRVTGRPADELRASLENMPLRPMELPALGATLRPGAGNTRIALSRVADSVSGVLLWTADNAVWEPTDTTLTSGAGATLWNVISRVERVDIQVSLGGTIAAPSISIRSNIGDRAAAALRERIGDEVARARSAVRQRVNGLTGPSIDAANGAVSGFQTDVVTQVDGYRDRIADVRAQLERRLRQLGPRIPGIGG